jgi:hypothetical protein
MKFLTYQQVANFLEKIDYKNSIVQSCTSFFNSSVDHSSCSPFRIDLNLDYNNNNGFESEEFLQYLIEEPKEFRLLCEDYIFFIAQQFVGRMSDSAILKREQISCSIKLFHLPMLDQHEFNFHSIHLNLGLTFIRCIILEVYQVERYM